MALRIFAAAAVAIGLAWAAADAAAQSPAVGQQAYGYQWGHSFAPTDWNRLYHYPYVWYPHNYYADGYMQSANDLYYRYPQEMRIPVYNRQWQNEYPKSRRYHHGHHFHLDVF
jgi:opacity protein-like surface antigen